MQNERPLIISHSPCLDGFTAAWAAWLKYPEAEFVPGVYGEAPPDITGRDVFLLDFSYKYPVMVGLVEDAKSVTVLDHHKSAQADLENLPSCVTPDKLTVLFDMNKSGARLAWEWFHPDTEVPLFVRLVEDRDLWRFSMIETRAMNAAFFSYTYEFDVWNTLASEVHSPDGFATMLAEGQAIERAQAKNVKELVSKLQHFRQFKKTLCGNVPCANLPYVFASEAANLMAQDAPFAVTYFQQADGQFNFSLRSVEGGADVSLIAAAYGGGGHKHAAGFRVKSLEEL